MTAYTPDRLEVSPPDQSLRSTSGSVVLDYLRALVAARDCAAALEAGQRPSDSSLRTLGIDPAAYAEVRLV
ncbi:MAG TPA: hypothetical protein PLR41_08475 [Alphaproteobacteria bacterium]|nr:hypothetical protein [Alphaproteobacteria bacterium]